MKYYASVMLNNEKIGHLFISRKNKLLIEIISNNQNLQNLKPKDVKNIPELKIVKETYN